MLIGEMVYESSNTEGGNSFPLFLQNNTFIIALKKMTTLTVFEMKEIETRGLIRAILFYPIITIIVAVSEPGGPCTPGLKPIMFLLCLLITAFSFLRYLHLTVLFRNKYLPTFLIYLIAVIVLSFLILRG